jgi:ABC-type multidrug transport system fused ATPase/permease subunit
MSGTVVGSLVELSASIIGAAIISLITGWKLALVALACLPLLIAANKMRIDMMRRGNVATKEHYEKSAQVACEAVGAMRTIASLTRERDVFNMYSLSLVEPLRIGHHHAYVGSLLFAVSQSFTFMMNAVVFYYGSQLFMKDGYDIRQMFTVLMASTFAGQSSGRVFSLFPDLTKSQIYACDILTLLARQPRIKMNEDKEKLDPATVEGHVEFKNVYFEYPTRPGIRVLKGLNMTVKPGQFVALVGSSGCGKSTTVGLMERFYDVTGGSVLLDGKNIETLNLPSVRRVTSMVGQEPSLFAGSIRENILLGREDENAVTQQQIEDAAKEANIHDFIMTLPDGYNTDVGTRGSQLSGG